MAFTRSAVRSRLSPLIYRRFSVGTFSKLRDNSTKVIWAFLSQVNARVRVGLGWAVLVYEGGMLWELEKMYVVGLPWK